jgi:group I intron endonuclease
MIVYVAINKINNKKYIGYTTGSLNDRIKNHVRKANNKNQKSYNYFFQRAIRKYSIDNFTWEILHVCKNKSECCQKEIEYIKMYNSICPNGYNLTFGGDGGIQSDLTKKKISNSVKKAIKLYPDKFNRMLNMTYESRSIQSKKAWETKKKNGYISRSGFKLSELSKNKMSTTKNNKNKLKWVNIITNEIVYKSLTDMSIFTGLTIGCFSHIKNKRQKKTKCGWMLYN